MRELMKQVIQTHSAAKTFPYNLEGLCSRNNKTRIECADLVGFLLDNYGAELKSLQIVASLTVERDGDTRKAALNTMATGYKILGENESKRVIDAFFLWKAVGEVVNQCIQSSVGFIDEVDAIATTRFDAQTGAGRLANSDGIAESDHIMRSCWSMASSL